MKRLNTQIKLLTGSLVTGVSLMVMGPLQAQNAPSAVSSETPNAPAATTEEHTEFKAKSFMKEAAEANTSEIRLAQIAEQKSQNADVKQLAQTLQQDHQQANQELQGIAQKRGIELTEKQGLKEDWKEHRLQKLGGAEFDKAYAEYMLKDHQQDLVKFQKAAENIQEPDVKQYAQSMLPKLRDHLNRAEQTARAVGVDPSTISSIMEKAPGGVGGTMDLDQRTTGEGSKKQ